jgi:hypothetical protein
MGSSNHVNRIHLLKHSGFLRTANFNIKKFNMVLVLR